MAQATAWEAEEAAALAAADAAAVEYRPWMRENGLRGDGPTWRFRVTDPADVTEDGVRCVSVRLSHVARQGVVIHFQPCRYSVSSVGFHCENFVMFCPDPREKPYRILLQTAARRSDKVTERVAMMVHGKALALAAAYLVDPGSPETAAAVAQLRAVFGQ